MSDDKPVKLLDVEEAAAKLRCHPKTLYANEDIPRVTIGRKVFWIESQVDTYLLNLAQRKAPRQTVMRQTPKLKEIKRRQRTGTESR